MQILGTMGRGSVGLIIAAAVVGLAGCANTVPQVTHHWVSQDKVAGNVYRNDVAACSAGNSELTPNTPEFQAYQACMNERGYALVAVNEVGEIGRD